MSKFKRQPDGPIKEGLCHDCGLYFGDDIYVYQDLILCGECRYWARHNKRPPREPTTPELADVIGGDHKYHGGFGSETINRFRHVEAISERHVRILQDMEQDRGD